MITYFLLFRNIFTAFKRFLQFLRILGLLTNCALTIIAAMLSTKYQRLPLGGVVVMNFLRLTLPRTFAVFGELRPPPPLGGGWGLGVSPHFLR